MSDAWLDAQPGWEAAESGLFAQEAASGSDFFEECATRSIPMEAGMMSPARGMVMPSASVRLSSNASDAALTAAVAGPTKLSQPAGTPAQHKGTQAISIKHHVLVDSVILPPQPMLLARTHFSVAVRADTRAAAAKQAALLLKDAQMALFDMDATLEEGDSKFSIVAHVHDPRTYGCVTFELSVHSPDTTPTESEELNVPKSFVVDVNRWSGDAFFFGSIFTEIRTTLQQRCDDRAQGKTDVADIVPRSGPDAVKRLATFNYFTVPDKLYELQAPKAATHTESVSSAAGQTEQSTTESAANSETDTEPGLPQPAVLHRCTSAQATQTVQELIQSLGDDSGCDFPASAASRLCELVNEDTVFGSRTPAAHTHTAAILESSELQQALAAALQRLVSSPCSTISVPLAVAAATLLRAASTSPGGAGFTQLAQALSKLSQTPFFVSQQLPDNVRECTAAAVACV